MKSLKEFISERKLSPEKKEENTRFYTPDELFEHFDIQNRGKVDIDDYTAVILHHINCPELLSGHFQDLNADQKEYSLGESDKNDKILKNLKENATLILEKDNSKLMHVHPQNRHDTTIDPPAVLIMRRKSIRQFADGKRVALYYVDKLNKYVTVPYEGMEWHQPLTAEGRKPTFNILEEISRSNKKQTIEHLDGSFSEVTVDMANQLLRLYKRINENNRLRMQEMLDASSEHFNKILNFSKG